MAPPGRLPHSLGQPAKPYAPQNTTAYTLSLDPTTLHEYDGRAYVTVTATSTTAATADTAITISLSGTATKDTDYALDTGATLPTITVKSGDKTGRGRLLPYPHLRHRATPRATKPSSSPARPPALLSPTPPLP